MRVRITILVLLFLEVSSSSFASAQTHPLETIKKEEFLVLPLEIQNLYLAGVIDGMDFVSYGNSDQTLGAWQNCVRKKTLGETTNEVVEFLKVNSDFNDPIPWAVAEIIGKRDCPRR